MDAIDPALRRPGRFDREFFFPLPPESARKKIIEITTSKWTPPLDEPLVNELARATRGYCGADVKTLCTEAALNAVRRSFPEIYDSAHKLEIALEDVRVTKDDFSASMKSKFLSPIILTANNNIFFRDHSIYGAVFCDAFEANTRSSQTPRI